MTEYNDEEPVFFEWVSDDDLDSKNEYNINSFIPIILLNILSLNTLKAKELIEKYNIDVNQYNYDYVYNEDRGQIIYDRTLLIWCLMFYMDNISILNFNHNKLYDFILYLIKEKIHMNNLNNQLTNSIELIQDSLVEVEINSSLSQSKRDTLNKQLDELDKKITLLLEHTTPLPRS